MAGDISVADLFAKLRLAIDERSWSIGDRIINGFKNKLAGMLGGLANPAAWEGAIGQVVDLGDHLDELGQQTGVPVETLQELGYAGAQSGVGIDSMSMSLGKLARNMDAAKRGSKEQASAFKKIGVSVTDASGKLRPVEDVFADLSDHFAETPAGAQKTADVMRIFGRSGAQLIPVLNNGSDGLARLRQEFIDTGAEIDGPTAAAFGTLNDQKDLLKTGWQGIKTQLASALLPTLLEVTKGFIAWFKANRGLIRSGIQVFAKVLGVAIKGVAYAVGALLKVFTYLGDHWDIAKFAIYALVAALGVYEAATIAAGIASAISWLVALWPLGLVLAAIALVVLAVQDFYTYLQGGDSYFGDLVDYAKQYLGIDLVNTVGSVVDFAVSAFGMWWDTAKGMFEFLKAEASLVEGAFTAVWNTIKPIVDAIKEAVGYIDDITNSDFNPFGGNFADSGSGLVGRPGRPALPQGAGALARVVAAQAGPTATSATATGQGIFSAFHANITVNATPGTDGKLIGEQLTRELDKHWDSKMRAAHAGAGGK